MVVCSIVISVEATYPQKQLKAASPTRKGVAQEDAEPGQQDDDFELVGDHTPCLYDTQQGRKLHYDRRCNGLKNAVRVISICSCSCWAITKTWPTPEVKVCRFTKGKLLQACCTGRCLSSSCRDEGPKEICKLCGWKYAHSPVDSNDGAQKAVKAEETVKA